MIDVKTDRIIAINGLDTVAKALLGAKVIGCSSGPRGATVHLVDNATQGDIDSITGVLTASETLAIGVDKVAIAADGVDTATVSYQSNVATVDYYAFVNGAAYASGTANGNGTVVTLTLNTLVAGKYEIYIVRQDTRASGRVEVTAS